VVVGRGGGGVGKHGGHIVCREGSDAMRSERLLRWNSSMDRDDLCLSCDQADVVVSGR